MTREEAINRFKGIRKSFSVTQKTFSDDYRGKPMMPNRKVKGACWYRSDSEWGDVVYDDSSIIAMLDVGDR